MALGGGTNGNTISDCHTYSHCAEDCKDTASWMDCEINAWRLRHQRSSFSPSSEHSCRTIAANSPEKLDVSSRHRFTQNKQ